MRLFADTFVILPLDEQLARGRRARLRLGEWPEGTLELDSRRARALARRRGAAIVVGSTLELFLTAVMAREGLLVDRDGEFKDVFDEERHRRARARASRRARR